MAKNKPHPQTAAQSRDWSLFGLRFVLLVSLVGYLYWQSLRNNGVPSTQTLFIEIAIGLVANLFLVVFILVPSIHEHARWVVMLGDWLIVGALTPLIYQQPMLMMALMGTLLALSAVRLGATLSIANGLVTVAVYAAVVLYLEDFRFAAIQNDPVTYGMPVFVGLFAALGLALMVFYEEKVFEERHQALSSAAQERHQLLQDMQERTTAITEMAQMLSSTLNYQRVLDAALSVGRLALHEQNDTTSFVSLVMLYRPEDRRLYTITGLGMARHDEGRVLSGRGGIVREALTLCEPVYGGHVRKDAELSDFATLRMARSVVVVPLRAGYDNYGVMIFGSRKSNAFNENYQTYLQAIGIQTTIALQNASLYQDLLEEKERIVEVEKEARKKLARDLHDGPTQTISAIAMRMSIIRMMLERTPDEVPAELKKIEELALQTTSEIRLMLYALRPLALESEGGITSALEQLADKFSAVYDQHVEVMVSDRAERMMTAAQSETVFSFVQETLNNARKHARAALVTVRVTTYDDVLVVEVADDGVGFDVEKQRAAARGRNSLGMQNLEDLANLLDGTLQIESTLGHGSTFSMLVPIDPAGLNGKPKPKPRPKNRKEKFRLTAIR